MTWFNKVADADASDKDLRVVVDGVAYSVSKKGKKINCEVQQPADFQLFMDNEKHRQNLATKATIAQREFSDEWDKESNDFWSVSIGGKSVKMSSTGMVKVKKEKKEKGTEQADPGNNESKEDETMKNAKSSEDGIQWWRSAEGNPFGDDKKDDKPAPFGDDKKDDKDEKKDDKPAPFGDDKKDDKGEKDDKGGDKLLEKALEMVEKIMDKDEAGGDPKLQEIADKLQEMMESNSTDEHGSGPGDTSQPNPARSKGPMKMQMEPAMPGNFSPEGPSGAPGHSATNPHLSTSGFAVGDLTWKKSMLGGGSAPGEDPGRIIAVQENLVVVDWGDEVASEEKPSDLVKVEADSESELFDSISVEVPEEYSSKENSTDVREEAEKVLAGMSLSDILDKDSAAEAGLEADVVHVASGTSGMVVATMNDGQILVKIAEEERKFWPFELKFLNRKESN